MNCYLQNSENFRDEIFHLFFVQFISQPFYLFNYYFLDIYISRHDVILDYIGVRFLFRTIVGTC